MVNSSSVRLLHLLPARARAGFRAGFALRAGLLAAFAVGGTLSAAAQATRIARAEVGQATVFRDRAQLTATAHATVERGTTEVLVGNLPVNLDPATVQVRVEAEGDGASEAHLTLLGVEGRTDHTTTALPRPLRALTDSLRAHEAQLRALVDQKELLEKEESVLAAAVSNAKADPDDLEDNVAFFRTRGTAIREALRQTNAQIERLQPTVQRWRQQVRGYEGARTTPAGQLALALSSEAHSAVNITLTYVTMAASWEPVYDLRAASTGGPVQLTYRAILRQNTGSDWKQIKLILSGGAPVEMSGSAALELATEYLRLDNPRLRAVGVISYSSPGRARRMTDSLEEAKDEAAASESAPEPAAPPVVAASRDGAAVRFELAAPFSVPADGRAHTVEVQQAPLPAAFGVTVVPKLDLTAFLTVALTGWGPLNLLPGRATTYLDGTYTGAFFLDPNASVDTLRLTLGPDRNVVVHREKSQEFSKRALFGSTVTDAVAYIITAKNQRSEPVSLRVEEQIPIAADSRVQVVATELSGAAVNPETGRLTWRTTLGAGQTRAWKLGYEVKYPKKMTLTQ